MATKFFFDFASHQPRESRMCSHEWYPKEISSFSYLEEDPHYEKVDTMRLHDRLIPGAYPRVSEKGHGGEDEWLPIRTVKSSTWNLMHKAL